MHLNDALIAPLIAGSAYTLAAPTFYYSAKEVRKLPEENVALMGAAGAFVFAAQMINVAIPGTGASGHLGGGLLLAILLGGPSAYMVMTAVLLIQALFFADGGVLALGANLINLGMIPTFLAYPLIYSPLYGLLLKTTGKTKKARLIAVTGAAIVGLWLGAISATFMVVGSGRTVFSFWEFGSTMVLIHTPIGIFEGLATALILNFLEVRRPGLIDTPVTKSSQSVRGKLITSAIILGGLGVYYGSGKPDGLEWVLQKTPWVSDLLEGFSFKVLAIFEDYQIGKLTNQPFYEKGLAGLFGVGAMLLIAYLGGLWFRKLGEGQQRREVGQRK